MMIANIGNSAIFIAFVLGSFLSILKIFQYKGNLTPLKIRIQIDILFHSLIIVSFLVMLYLFIISDMRVVSVLMHSSSLLDLKYRIAGTWGSHETSMMFWATINSVIYIIYNFRTKDTIANTINNIIQTGFVAYIFFFSNPFLSIESPSKEGLGMNPSLQDVGMMVHPPILFLSYGFYQIIYSSTIASLLGEKIDNRIILNISRIAFSLITSAVALGGWWAYRELGWGGYWFFDPVENISLVVWLFGVSFHHSLLQKNMEISKYLLGISSFITIIFGTFFVRSGLLTSVHSFAEAKGSSAILIFAVILLSFPIILLFIKSKSFFHQSEFSRKYYFMQIGNILWTMSGLIIIVTLIIPIFSDAIINDIVEIKPIFFTKTIIPLMLLASGLSGLIYFNRDNRKLLIALLINFPVIPLSDYFMKSTYLISISYFVSSLIITSTIYRFYERIKANTLKTKTISMLLGHFAAGLFILAVSLNNNLSFSKNLVLNINDTIKFKDSISVNLSEIKYSHSSNYFRQIVKLKIMDSDKEITTLNPELRFYPVENSLSSEVDIFSFLTSDWYGVINNIDKDRVSILIIHHRAISLIWFSIFLCVFAIILTIDISPMRVRGLEFRKNKEIQ